MSEIGGIVPGGVIGLHGCRCHPFKTYDELKAWCKRPPFKIGDKTRHMCRGIEGEVFELLPEKGYLIVKYGPEPCDLHLEHSQNLIKIEMKDTYIPRQIFDQMTKVNSCQSISMRGTVDGIIEYNSKQWVVVGSISSARTGYTSVTAHQVLELEKYEGKLQPLDHDYHMAEIAAGKRERGYAGDIVKYKGKSFVMIDPQYCFMPAPVNAPAKTSTKKEIIIPGFRNYDGGKSGDGTYQALINHVPPHGVKIIPFAGMCGLTRFIRPARLNIINDLDISVIDAWEQAVGDYDSFRLFSLDATSYFLRGIAQLFDTADTFIYLDPPYMKDSRKFQRDIYQYEMSDAQHMLLLAIIQTFKHARIMISAYPNDFYDEQLSDWHTYDFWSATRGAAALERIYMNYKPGPELHDYSYIGKDYREREALARQKKNFLNKVANLDPRLRNAVLSELDRASQNNAVENRKNLVTMEDAMNVASLAKYCGGYKKKGIIMDRHAEKCDA